MTCGDVLLALGKNDAAVENYTSILSDFPKFSRIYEMHAKAYRALDKVDLAVADEKKAKELQGKE